MKRYRQHILGLVVVSAAFHLLLFAIFPPQVSRNKPVAMKPSYVQIVKISPEAPDLSKTSAKPRDSQEKSEKPKQGAAPAASSPRASNAKTYKDLLNLGPPLYSDEILAPDSNGKTPYAGSHLGELIAETTDFSAHFDLPLVLRRSVGEGHAWATLVRHKDYIELKYLGGHREIRAALFEALQAKETYHTLAQAFVYFKTDQLKVSVRFVTELAAASEVEFKTERRVYDKELEITMRRYARAPQYGVTGMAIEDKYSRMAKKKDRMHRSRLIRSKAFQKPISNFRLTAP